MRKADAMTALDLLGIEEQLVFSTLSSTSRLDPTVLSDAARMWRARASAGIGLQVDG